MPWGSQSWARLTKESTYGVFDASAIPTNIIWCRLAANNSCTVRSVPQRMIIRSADADNRRRQVVASRQVVSGNLNTLWYPTQSAFWLGAALTLTANDLPSYTLDFWDTQQGYRFTGGKIASLNCAGTATGDYIPLTTSWVFQSKSTNALADPGVTVFPTEIPYTHHESMGHLSVGTTVTKYSSLGFSIKNTLDPTWDEDTHISALYYCGRDIDLNLRLQYVSTVLRGNLEAQTPLAVSAGWSRAAGLTSTLNLEATNYVADVGDDLPLNAAAYQTIGLQAFFDQAAASDCAFTVA
jgi:hypothetical protein